ncbi:3-ketoacyl-CoA thiolase [Vibrio stylophorae]|uniref:acetyl-CoA C-acyltransferase n=1 Tax=Vibrio stylophorae TaxID=659351 RepID=A0ABN8DY31_9VIBR|nr:acetyl-CoA C-acyltransferase FadA [Vibrio stylophorae]CAH0534745.1 3-ketoacyl-CoA thiolase [Vibrio stylophorae]
MHEVVIVDCLRTPMGRSKEGAFRHVRAESLAADLMRAMMARHPELSDNALSDIYWGCVQQTREQGFNIARNAALLAGIANTVPAVTVNRLCGSAMQAVHDASRAIMVGDAQCCLAGGVEHMGHVAMTDGIDFHPQLSRHLSQASLQMGLTAEMLARIHGITRQEQDAFALRSHQLAHAAQQRGEFAEVIAPREGHDADGNLYQVHDDEVIRADATLEQLSALKPVFDPANGTVTAGNASALSDGAATLMLASRPFAESMGLPIRAAVRAMTVTGCDPAIMGYGPVPATQQLLKKMHLKMRDIDVIELNEAFAAQAIPCVRELGLADQIDDKVNLQGGAIALGHPLGCSGARILTNLVQNLELKDGAMGIATMCIGLGQGIATLIERLD